MSEKRSSNDLFDQKEELASASNIEVADVNLTEWTVGEEARIRRKLDLRLVPIVFILYLLCFIDRANIGNARILGLATDLKLTGFRFNWALTIFYISYFIVEIPSNMLLKMIGAQIYLPLLVFAFGLVSMCTAFVTSYNGLLVCRFFLGLAEGGVMPGIAYYLSCFYRRSELLFRIGAFVSGASLAGAFGGLLAAGLSQIPEWGAKSMPIHTWRNIFFFEGLVTIVVALVVIRFLPSTPAGCRFLSAQEIYIASERINKEHKESDQGRVTSKNVYRALFNINNVICGLTFMFANVAVQSLSLFMPTILRALGWTAITAQLYTVPVYVSASVVSITMAWLSDRLEKRGIFIVGGSLVAIAGYATLVSFQSPNVKYGAVYVVANGIFSIGTSVLAWTLNNAAGQGVRAVSSAFVVAMGNGGALIAVWSYLPSDAPQYRKGHFINLGAEVAVCTLGIIGILYVKWENRQRESGKRDHRLNGLNDQEADSLGYRHPEFRYIE